jgi:hypothetical protein
MFDFINNAFSFIKSKVIPVNDNNKWIDNVKNLSKLSDEINKEQELLNDAAYEIIKTNKEDLYISLSDFFNLMNDEKLTMDKILHTTKHKTEINANNSSVIEVYPIVENDHIVLCPDKDNCEQHKHYSGNKIKIVSIR